MYLPAGLSLDGLEYIIHRPTQACYFYVSFHPLQDILIGLRVNEAELKRRLAAPVSPSCRFYSFLSTCLIVSTESRSRWRLVCGSSLLAVSAQGKTMQVCTWAGLGQVVLG